MPEALVDLNIVFFSIHVRREFIELYTDGSDAIAALVTWLQSAWEDCSATQHELFAGSLSKCAKGLLMKRAFVSVHM